MHRIRFLTLIFMTAFIFQAIIVSNIAYSKSPKTTLEDPAYNPNDVDDFNKSAGIFVLDLTDKGSLFLSGNGSLIYWDWDNDGHSEQTGWISPNAGILFMDADKDGKVNSSNDMQFFKTKDGFAAFDKLDENADKKIDKEDRAFKNLKVWMDSNLDAVSQIGETKTLAEMNIESISVEDGKRRRLTVNGNKVIMTSSYSKTIQDKKHLVLFVSIAYNNANTKYTKRDISRMSYKNIPAISIRGRIPHLWRSMQSDKKLLKMGLDIITLSPSSIEEYFKRTYDLMLRWSKSSRFAKDAKGPYMNARELTFLEMHNKTLYFNPKAVKKHPGYAEVEQSLKPQFRKIHKEVFCSLYAGSLGKDFFPNIPLMILNNRDRPASLGLKVLASQHEPADEENKLLFWSTIVSCNQLFIDKIQVAMKQKKAKAIILGRNTQIPNIKMGSNYNNHLQVKLKKIFNNIFKSRKMSYKYEEIMGMRLFENLQYE